MDSTSAGSIPFNDDSPRDPLQTSDLERRYLSLLPRSGLIVRDGIFNLLWKCVQRKYLRKKLRTRREERGEDRAHSLSISILNSTSRAERFRNSEARAFLPLSLVESFHSFSH